MSKNRILSYASPFFLNLNLKYVTQENHLQLVYVILITFILYSLGLKGRFVFDDYPQIVLNENLTSIHNLNDFLRLFASGNAGPGGRPLALITFAAQIAWTGLNPLPFKLVNILLHLLNGVLLYSLLANISSTSNIKSLAPKFQLAVVSWWLLNPMALTSVLYIVQRMNELSATFTLAGLILYTKGRNTGGLGNVVAILGLSAFTTAAFLSKENGILTLAYAYIIEVFIYDWQDKTAIWKRLYSILKRLQIPAFIIAISIVIGDFDQSSYQGRTFSLSERLLTESRVLWFYIRQIVIPDLSQLHLYHDGFVISKSLLDPISTAIALAAHTFIVICILFLRKQYYLISLGLAWFYVGHIAESTIYPLELVFEHRNYLPMIGIIISIAATLIYIKNNSIRPTVLHWTLAVLIIASASVTSFRAFAWGDPLYPLKEAEANPDSARANYDAAVTFVHYMKEVGDFSPNAITRAKKYLEVAIRNDKNALAPFVAKLDLFISANRMPPEQFWTDFEHRARSSLIHPAFLFSLKNLNDLLFMDSAYYTDVNAERIYKAILENKEKPIIVAAHTWFIYGLLWGKRNDPEKRIAYIRKAIETKGNILDFRIIYIGFLKESKLYSEAMDEISIVKKMDKYGVYENQLTHIINSMGGDNGTSNAN